MGSRGGGMVLPAPRASLLPGWASQADAVLLSQRCGKRWENGKTPLAAASGRSGQSSTARGSPSAALSQLDTE